ncbi:MAG: FHA domain-containing protein [Cyanobacteria bacterium J06598_3]
MITCPNCNHQNPDGALQCEACYTPLPALIACPSCNAQVQADASFCGQCGHDLRSLTAPGAASESATTGNTEAPFESPAPSGVSMSEMKTQNFSVPTGAETPAASSGQSGNLPGDLPENLANEVEFPDLVAPDPLIELDPVGSSPSGTPPIPEPEAHPAISTSAINPPEATPSATPDLAMPEPQNAESPATTPPAPVPSAPPRPNATQLQVVTARLRHVQTDTLIEIPTQLSVVRIGKPNDQTPPDIDVSGFPDSEVVSRVHGNLRVEGDVYYLEDVGSSNGTYINGLPLPAGNRHRLRPGDRIALGKGDKVSFTFETT